MNRNDLETIFDAPTLGELLPPDRSDDFFEALLGDAEEGAYTIALSFKGGTGTQLNFHLELQRRPQKCLVCNLTYGLPEVFQRHPVINLKGLVDALAQRITPAVNVSDWTLGATQEISTDLHVIPLTIHLKSPN